MDDGKNKFKRRFKEQSREKFIDFQRLRAQNEFEILRNETKICRLINNIHTKTIDKTIYPYVEPPKESKKDKNKDKDSKKTKGGVKPMSFGDGG